MKTDKRDAEKIARCLAFRTYKPVAVPTEDTEMVKDFIRMRNDHKQALTKTRQQINAFCLRHKLHYTAGKHKWTQKHLEWLGKLSLDASLREILDGYLLTQNYLLERITQMDKRIEELSRTDKFNEKAKN